MKGCCFTVSLLLLSSIHNGTAFQTPSRHDLVLRSSSSQQQQRQQQQQQHHMIGGLFRKNKKESTEAAETVVAEVIAEEEETTTTTTTTAPPPLMTTSATTITPEGYGFSSPTRRILRKAARDNAGYYAARASEPVTSVIAAMTSPDSTADVALVFSDDDQDGDENEKLLGIFTETDYIQLSTNRVLQSSSEEESASYLVQPVQDYMTSPLVTLSTEATASQAIALMQQNSCRHVIITTATADNSPVGVISMQDVMTVVQKDESLSLDKLAKKYPGIRSPLDQMREQLKSRANDAANNEDTGKQDVLKTGTLALSGVALTLFFSDSAWLHQHADWAMIGIFVLGYVGIIFEEVFEFNKAAVALLMSTGLWVTYADFFNENGATPQVLDQLSEQLAEVSDICFFLLAASTIVEVVDSHQGFKVVTNQIKTNSKQELFWTIGFLTFFLSAILNNLTVTIVMCSLLRKLIPNEQDRKLFGAMVVVAANAGGVWTPIGDVTTTMLWINNQLSTVPTVLELFVPSLVCLVGSLFFLVKQVEEDDADDDNSEKKAPMEQTELAPRGTLVFWSGIACLLAVPVFAELTGLPPYLAMLTGLGAMWTLTDILHLGEEGDSQLKVPAALAKLDTSGILFFLGILMSIGVLDKSGLLKELAVFLSNNLPSLDIIATVIGLASALIDNVPLVAATMGMYDLTEFGTDDKLWQLIALCAGTGGSILVIGSASGVALMGLEKVDFLWYAKNVSIGATIGYFAGIATYLAQNALLSSMGIGIGIGGGGGAASMAALPAAMDAVPMPSHMMMDSVSELAQQAANLIASVPPAVPGL